MSDRLPRWRTVTAAAIATLAVVNLPAIWTGGFVDPALERDQDVPSSWTEAVGDLDAGSPEHRVLQLPGSEFGAFRWGYTVDPPLPGLTDKPLITRDLLPLGSPGAMDLLYALDNRVQAGTIEPDAIAPIARLLAADTIWLANDLAFDRFRTPRPEVFADLFRDEVTGLGAPRPFGRPVVNVPDIPMVDEQLLSDARIGTSLAPVELVDVDDPVPVIRASSAVVLVAGSGDGLVDAAAAHLLSGHETVLYTADVAAAPSLPEVAIPPDALLVVTDSARDRAMHWRSSQDVLGLTEVGGPGSDVTRATSADQRLQVFASDDEAQQTVARLDGGLVVRASSYGEPFAYRPEDRPAMAVDADPTTAWRVADRADPIGESIEVSTTDGRLVLLQQQRPDANRRISAVSITTSEGVRRHTLDETSTAAPGQVVEVPAGEPVTITITGVVDRPEGTDTGPSAVGFAELGPVGAEVVRLPTAPVEEWSSGRPLALVLTRERVRTTNRWRTDPEPRLVRRFDLPDARRFDVRVTLGLDGRAADGVLARLVGRTRTAEADRRLTGVPDAGGPAALDSSPTTAWTTPFGEAVGATLRVPLAGPLDGPFVVRQPVDGLHSRITRLTLRSGDGGELRLDVPMPDPDGRSTVDPGTGLRRSTANGAVLEIRIDAIDPVAVTDRRYAEQLTLPASIVEIEGLPVAVSEAAPVERCHRGLLSIDGRAVGVQFGDEVATRLRAGEPVEVPLCGADSGALELSAGSHRVDSSGASATGVHVNRVVLSSVDIPVTDGGATDGGASQRIEASVERARTTRTAVVEACPKGCWLVLGEGYNPAWDATTADGTSLGPPLQVGGGFNGWWLEPSETGRTVVMTWTPQRSLDAALLIAASGVLACLALVVTDRRRHRRQVARVPGPRLVLVPPVVDRRRAAVGAVLLVVGATLVIAPVWGVIALVPAAWYAAVRRPGLLGVSAAVGAALIGLLVTARQYRFGYLPDAAWPGHFEDVHRVGLFIIVLVAVGASTGDQDTAIDTTEGPRNDSLTQ